MQAVIIAALQKGYKPQIHTLTQLCTRYQLSEDAATREHIAQMFGTHYAWLLNSLKIKAELPKITRMPALMENFAHTLIEMSGEDINPVNGP